MDDEVQSEIVDDNLVEKAEELHANTQEGEEEAVHVVIETTGENAIDSVSRSSPPTLNYKEVNFARDSAIYQFQIYYSNSLSAVIGKYRYPNYPLLC